MDTPTPVPSASELRERKAAIEADLALVPAMQAELNQIIGALRVLDSLSTYTPGEGDSLTLDHTEPT
jgi:hypothetical protein